MPGIGGHARCGKHRGRPVHAHALLGAGAAGGYDGGPVRNPGHADAAFGQVHLAAHQRPVVREAFAAVVAGEDDQRVVQLAVGAQRLDDPAYALVHVMDHAAVLVDVAARQMRDAGAQLLGRGTVIACFPGPVRGRVVQAQEERGIALAHAVDEIHAALRQQIGQIAFVVVLFLAHPQVMLARAAQMGEIVHAARHGAEVFLVTRAQRAEVGRVAQMPFADQRGAVARILEQRGYGGHFGRQAQLLAQRRAAGLAVDGFSAAPRSRYW